MISCLHHMLSNAAQKWPRRIALIEIKAKGAGKITYGELWGKIENLSGQILEKGLHKGDRVGILSRNSIEGVAVFFAVCRAGGAFVPLNYTLNPQDIIYQANDCEISGVYFGNGFEDKAKNVKGRVKSIKFTVEYDRKYRGSKKFLKISERDLASVIYTSGTTRYPIGVMLSHRNIVSNSNSIARYANLSGSDRICCVLPFYYIFGLSLLFSHFLIGGTVIIDNRFMYPNIALDGIEKYKATGFAGVSSHYVILLNKTDFKKRKLPNLRYFMQAGDRMPPNITNELIGAFPDKNLYIMYGLTEASPRLTYLDPALVRQKPESIGRAIPGVRIKVVDSKGVECKAGEAGEIVARGKNIMLGYWNNSKETRKAIRNNWLHTGDIAFKDEDGDLFIVGRKKNFIKVGAHRINPQEIEALVLEDDRVMEAAAIDIPDKILGKKIKLFVSLAPGAKINEDDIIRFYRNRLPSYKVPSEVAVLRAMPKNSFGKIDKQKLKLG